MQLSCNPNLEELENFVCVEGWGVWSPINTKMSVSFLNGGNYHQTIKSLEENIRMILCDLRSVHGFSDLTPKSQAIRGKKTNWTSLKIRTFVH